MSHTQGCSPVSWKFFGGCNFISGCGARGAPRHSARQSPGDRTGQPSPRRASWGSRGPRRYLRRPGRGDSVQPSSGILGPNSQSSFPIIRCAKWASTRHHSWESILEQGMVSSHPLYPNQNIHKLEKKKKRPWARHSLSVSQVDQL